MKKSTLVVILVSIFILAASNQIFLKAHRAAPQHLSKKEMKHEVKRNHEFGQFIMPEVVVYGERI